MKKLHLIKHPEKYTMHVRCDHYVYKEKALPTTGPYAKQSWDFFTF
jgi:hypothetical protein